MANNFAADFNQKPLHMSDYGNAVVEDYRCLGTGILDGEKMYFGTIPAGTRVTNVSVVNAAAGANVVLDLGYEPAESSPTASANYWFNDLAVATAGRAESSAAPITFERPVHLVGLVTGANVTGSPAFTVVVTGKAVGVR
jgi:hypothetical protein